MDKTTKNIIYLALAIVLGAIALQFIFRFWWTILVAIVAFVIGYFVGKNNND